MNNYKPKTNRSSTKLIKALLDGSAQEEQETLAKLKEALGFRSSPFQTYGFPYPVVVPYQQQQQQAVASSDPLFEMMRRFMAKKVLKKVSGDEDEDFASFFGLTKRSVSSF